MKAKAKTKAARFIAIEFLENRCKATLFTYL
jgi:hypothetical protein